MIQSRGVSPDSLMQDLDNTIIKDTSKDIDNDPLETQSNPDQQQEEPLAVGLDYSDNQGN